MIASAWPGYFIIVVWIVGLVGPRLLRLFTNDRSRPSMRLLFYRDATLLALFFAVAVLLLLNLWGAIGQHAYDGALQFVGVLIAVTFLAPSPLLIRAARRERDQRDAAPDRPNEAPTGAGPHRLDPGWKPALGAFRSALLLDGISRRRKPPPDGLTSLRVIYLALVACPFLLLVSLSFIAPWDGGNEGAGSLSESGVRRPQPCAGSPRSSSRGACGCTWLECSSRSSGWHGSRRAGATSSDAKPRSRPPARHCPCSTPSWRRRHPRRRPGRSRLRRTRWTVRPPACAAGAIGWEATSRGDPTEQEEE